ncbi:MAG: copper-binding protein [Burkholderiaceae bacterium]|nr:copper-binding protein [Burkholderiaceae bacterium]
MTRNTFKSAANVNVSANTNTNAITTVARRLIFGAVLSSVALLASAAEDLTNGVVRRIDAANGKVTIKHDEIVNLDMPGMTMVFKLQDKAQATGLSVGQAVRFHVEMEGDAMVITHIEAAQ